MRSRQRGCQHQYLKLPVSERKRGSGECTRKGEVCNVVAVLLAEVKLTVHSDSILLELGSALERKYSERKLKTQAVFLASHRMFQHSRICILACNDCILAG